MSLDDCLALHPGVAVRPERFGALLYHFGTRRLSFLKDPRLLQVVQSMDGRTTTRQLCAAAGVTSAEQPAFTRALTTLQTTGMLQ